MPYLPTNIIARRGYSDMSGLGGWSDIWGKIKEGAGTAIDYYGQTQQAQGAAAAQAAQNAALTQALIAKPAGSGITTTHLAIAGGVGLLALFLVMRK